MNNNVNKHCRRFLVTAIAMVCDPYIPLVWQTLWRNQEIISNLRFQQFPWKNSRELNPTCSIGTLSAFGKKGNIFSICYSTGEFLLHVVKVMLTAIACC
jgi:hypothetical protein